MREATPNAATVGGTRFQIRPGKPILSQNDADNGVTENALLMGIDLGTSRSSIVSMNGIRKTVESYVGFARDPVARKFLKTDVIYGKAALDNRLSVDLYRPLEKGVIKGTLENAGEVSFGLAKWTAYVPPGMVPTGANGILPPRIVLDCRDGTFQEFQRGTG